MNRWPVLRTGWWHSAANGGVRLVACLLVVVALSCASREPAPAPSVDAAFLKERGIAYRLEVRDEPRPLRIHHLRIELTNDRIELAAGLAADPDGAGPATGELELPMSIAKRMSAIALVNANPWQSTADEQGRRTTNWREGLAVEAAGVVASLSTRSARAPAALARLRRGRRRRASGRLRWT